MPRNPLTQCELWTDNSEMENCIEAYDNRLNQYATATYELDRQEPPLMVAESQALYGANGGEENEKRIWKFLVLYNTSEGK